MSFSNITNIYELLDQDGEEGVARLPPKKEVVAPKPAAPATKTATPAVKSAQQSSSNKTQSPKGERRQGDGQRRDNRPRPPRQQQQGGQGETERQPVEFARRDRTGDRQQAREKGESRGDAFRRQAPAGEFIGNKRVYDRKSGTGRGDGQGRENKRGGRGKGGWGANDGSDTVAEDIKQLGKEGENIVLGEGVADNKGTDATADKLEEQTPKEETEEEKKKREEREKEEKQVSWSDYQKQLAEKKSQSSLLQASATATRKANEGVDDKTAKKWNTYEQIKRDEVAPKTEEKKSAETKAKKQTVRLDELFNIKEAPKPQYSDDNRDRKGGKGKNFEKKGGNREKKQGGQPQQSGAAAPADDKPIFDSASFPTLIKN